MSELQSNTLEALSKILGTPITQDLSKETVAPEFLSKFDIGFARTHKLLGINRSGELHLAVCDRDGWRHADVVNRVLGKFAEPIVATEDAITRAINSAYTSQQSRTQDVIDTIDDTDGTIDMSALAVREDLLDTDGRAPVIRLVNHLISDAVKAGASDIHIQPYEDRIVVRQRIDLSLIHI